MSCHPSETVPMLRCFGVAFRVIVVFAACFDNRASEPTDKGAPAPAPLLFSHSRRLCRCCRAVRLSLSVVVSSCSLARSLARALSFSPRRPLPPPSAPSIPPALLPPFRRAVATPSFRRRKRRKKEPRVQRMKNGRHEQGDRHAHALQRVVAAEVCVSCHREA